MSELQKVLEEALRLERDGELGALLTLVDAGGSTPRHDIARMIVRADGSTLGTIGGGQIEHSMTLKAGEVIASGTPVFVERDLEELGMTCGGSVRVLVEPIGTSPKLVIFGAGHVAVEVAALAARCGFIIAVVDDRPEFASSERFPDARLLVHSFDPEDWEVLHLDPRSYVVVATRGHAHDRHVVRALIERELTYLGMMGSERKVADVHEKLVADGVEPPLLDKLHAPIGVDINSETPAEIAVSILGQLIQVRRSATS